MNKVYFSKSKSGNFDDIVHVRNILKEFNVEIDEFNGGKFSMKPVLECDILLILPPKLPNWDSDSINVGSGQTQMAQQFNKKVYVIVKIVESNLVLQELQSILYLGIDYQTNYSKLLLEEEKVIFSELFDKKQNKQEIKGIDIDDIPNML